MTTALNGPGGRANQKARTRAAILEACGELVRSGAEVSMPEVAARAMVSEATAYRYFPDLISLLQEALEGLWPAADQALAPVADSRDPVERVTFACEYLLRGRARLPGRGARDDLAHDHRARAGADPSRHPVRPHRLRARALRGPRQPPGTRRPTR